MREACGRLRRPACVFVCALVKEVSVHVCAGCVRGYHVPVIASRDSSVAASHAGGVFCQHGGELGRGVSMGLAASKRLNARRETSCES